MRDLNECLLTHTENWTVCYLVIKPGGEVRKSRGGDKREERGRGKEAKTAGRK